MGCSTNYELCQERIIELIVVNDVIIATRIWFGTARTLRENTKPCEALKIISTRLDIQSVNYLPYNIADEST